ncbi:MAG: PilZ domain-containing protein [Treponema sp.]|jgi:DNA-binding response OmpR family regulator|nr:PilZ domain-containing protein [Treponema sp.]
MKLLLILGSDDNYDAISHNTQAMGFELIRYRHVLKAMDNIDEVDPEAIIISARDFPRHWKLLMQFIRSERSKEVCPIIILKGENFNSEETSKAFFLGANGVFADTLENREDVDRLKNALDRYAPTNGDKKRHFFVEPWHRIGLLIANFSGKSIFTADVKTISANGLSFSPLSPLPANAVLLNRELRECSLRTGSAILSPVCRITGAGNNISLEFVSFPNDERKILNQYLESGIDTNQSSVAS